MLAGLVERLVGRLPGLGRGWRPVGGVGMRAALATVSELVRAGLGRLVCRLGWANGWSVAGGPAACHGAALPVGRQQGWAGAGGQWAGLLCAGGCWPVRAGLGKLVGQLSWTVPPPHHRGATPSLALTGQKQATAECENEGSDLFRNYWIYEVMFRCSVLARSDAVRSKDCFL